MQIPGYWKDFRDEKQLANTVVRIPAADDRSKGGADTFLEIWQRDSIPTDVFKIHPGIKKFPEGYFPIGEDHSTGELHCIRVEEGDQGGLYCIYLTLPFRGGYCIPAILPVLRCFRDLLNYERRSIYRA